MEATTTKMKLKKGDQVVVIAGKEKGKTGTVSKVSPATNRVVVAGGRLFALEGHTGSAAIHAYDVYTGRPIWRATSAMISATEVPRPVPRLNTETPCPGSA